MDVLHHIGIDDAYKILKKLSKISKHIIIKDHFENGFFMSANGFEFAFALLGASVALMFSGAGKYSLDALLLNKGINKRDAS